MPTIKQKKAFKALGENGGNISKAMATAGYSITKPNVSTDKLTNSKGWQELMELHLPEKELAKKHKELLNSSRMDHMVFPLGPKGEDDINFSGAKVTKGQEEGKQSEMTAERTTLTDKEIVDMLAEVNCKVRRIVHGETARHVYFWSNDNKARKDALDMAYKLRGLMTPEKEPPQMVQINIQNILSKSYGENKG